MNAYMACCCGETPCFETECESGRIFVCGTLYVSRTARENHLEEINACCGQGPANGNTSSEVEANSYFSLSFKSLLKLPGSVAGGNYPTLASAQISLRGQSNSRSYSDNTDGCGNPPTYSRETIQTVFIETGDQEETQLGNVDVSLGESTSNCTIPMGITFFPCFSNGEDVCFQYLRIAFSATKLAEKTSDYTHTETDPNENWNSQTNEEELVGLSWESYFVNKVQSGRECDWLYWDSRTAYFQYHEIENCIQDGPCNCLPEPCYQPCEGQNYSEQPLPCCAFSVSDLEIGASVPVECCAMNLAGMYNGKVFEDTRNFYTDCFGVGTCNDIPDSLPSVTISRVSDRFGQFEYNLQITKWQFIRTEDLPEEGPNWTEELSCV